jgi:hypothetical protein
MEQIYADIFTEGIPFDDFEAKRVNGRLEITSIGARKREKNMREGNCLLYDTGCNSVFEGDKFCFIPVYAMCPHLRLRVEEERSFLN